MRRIIVLVISCLFFFCLFRDMTVVKTLLCALVMACAYAISRIDQRYLLAAKYPLIGLCLALSPVLVIYPAFRHSPAAAAAAVLLAFYSIALFLVTTEEKGRKAYKEITGLSLLYGASSLNLFLTGHSELILPLSIAVLVFLFIINRITIMAYIAAYTVVCTVFFSLKGVPLFGGALPLNDSERYVLLACAFALLVMTFAAFLKRTDVITVLAFFGLLYVSVDLLMSVGLHLRTILLYQPVLGLLIIGPLVGMVMKKRERTTMKLLIAAGGTGGHIFPGISVAEALTAQAAGEVVFAGTPYGLEEKLIPQSGYRLARIEAKPFTGTSLRAKAQTMLAVVRGTLQARRLIKAEKPDAVLGMGGFASVPAVLAGLSLRVPCFLHEQNIYPGLANRLLSGRVKAVFVSFAETAAYLKAKETIHTGNPIRKSMRGTREAARGSAFTIFVFGGSRGARSVNNAALELLPYLEAYRHTVVCHQTGREDFDRIRAGYNGSGTSHEVFPFTDHMEKYYNLADVVVSRAGASTIFELAYFKKPAIFIPYPYAAGGHQWKNASYVEGIGGAYVIGNSEVSGERLYLAITSLRENPEERARMAENIGTIYVEDAGEKVVRGLAARVP